MTDAELPLGDPGTLNRGFVLIYGVLSYLIGVLGLVAIIALAGGLSASQVMTTPGVPSPIIWNLGLVTGWGLIHSGMARKSFKRFLTSAVPEPAERPTYVLVAGLSSLLMVWAWQEVPDIVWSVESPMAAGLLWLVFAFGWSYTLAATFAINHFDLFGLRQVYFHFRQFPRPPLSFVKRAMYRFSRHPIQAGVLIGVWATPLMDVTHLLLSLGFTIYIFAGLWFEERDLIRDIGEPYVQYRREAGMFLPKLW